MLLSAHMTGGNVEINSYSGCTQYDCDQYAYNALSPLPVPQMVPETLLFLRPAVILHLMVNRRYKPTIIKTHSSNTVEQGIELIPQDLTGGAVYLVRDPRDVVCSFAKHTGTSIELAIANMNEPKNRLQNPGSAIATWLGTWSDHVKSWDKPGLTRIRYEDMLEDTEGEFIKILKGFRIKVDEKNVKKAVKVCQLKRLSKQEDVKGFTEVGKQKKFFGQGKGWRNELTENQVKKIEMDHGEVMEQLGYKLEYL